MCMREMTNSHQAVESLPPCSYQQHHRMLVEPENEDVWEMEQGGEGKPERESK